LKKTLDTVFQAETIEEQLSSLGTKCGDKFPLLVLIDLGGTIFLRTSDKAAKSGKFFKKINWYMFFQRPGAFQLLKNLNDHPRITMSFFTSVQRKNILPALLAVLDDPLLLDLP